MRTCSVPGCDRKHVARGFCGAHYRRLRRTGNIGRDKPFKKMSMHGMSRTPEYQSWNSMIERCYNQNVEGYPHYGGRGITVCKKWRESFESFLNDMGQKPSGMRFIDRIDPDGNYEPNNCRWVSSVVSNRNRRFNKLSLEKAKDIRKMKKSGCHISEICLKYNISKANAYRVINGELWNE
jgi:hypothetical protein